MSDKNQLTIKQEQFCKEYLIDLNATQACIRAGYSQKGAGVQGGKLLEIPRIKAKIKEFMDKRSEKVEITAENVLRELGKVAFADLRKLYNTNGSLKSMHELDDDTAAIISSFKTRIEKKGDDDYDVIDEYKRFDKIKALELIGKHLNMFDGKDPNAGKGPKTQGKRVTIARRSDRKK